MSNDNATAADEEAATPLPPTLTIHHAAQWHAQLRDAIDSGRTRIDLAQVESLDTAGVQLLAAARRCAAERGQALEFTNAQAAVQDVLRRYALHSLLAAAGDNEVTP